MHFAFYVYDYGCSWAISFATLCALCMCVLSLAIWPRSGACDCPYAHAEVLFECLRLAVKFVLQGEVLCRDLRRTTTTTAVPEEIRTISWAKLRKYFKVMINRAHGSEAREDDPDFACDDNKDNVAPSDENSPAEVIHRSLKTKFALNLEAFLLDNPLGQDTVSADVCVTHVVFTKCVSTLRKLVRDGQFLQALSENDAEGDLDSEDGKASLVVAAKCSQAILEVILHHFPFEFTRVASCVHQITVESLAATDLDQDTYRSNLLALSPACEVLLKETAWPTALTLKKFLELRPIYVQALMRELESLLTTATAPHPPAVRRAIDCLEDCRRLFDATFADICGADAIAATVPDLVETYVAMATNAKDLLKEYIRAKTESEWNVFANTVKNQLNREKLDSLKALVQLVDIAHLEEEAQVKLLTAEALMTKGEFVQILVVAKVAEAKAAEATQGKKWNDSRTKFFTQVIPMDLAEDLDVASGVVDLANLPEHHRIMQVGKTTVLMAPVPVVLESISKAWFLTQRICDAASAVLGSMVLDRASSNCRLFLLILVRWLNIVSPKLNLPWCHSTCLLMVLSGFFGFS